jgi:ABC-type glycerol-3-phosphate transport system permease component
VSTTSAQFSAVQPNVSGGTRAIVTQRRFQLPWKAMGRHAVLLLLCFWVLFPLVVLILNSMKSRVDSVQRNIWPHEFVSPVWARYIWVWNDFTLDNIFFRAYWNSLFVTGLTIVIGTISAVMAGYALSHLATPGK